MKQVFVIFTLFFLFSCASVPKFAQHTPTTKIAFLADIHFHDVYGELSDNDYQGMETDTAEGEKKALIRSMHAQLHSTRLFNENYFVLLKALDDLAERGIELVVLPGDFSDDGQPMHVKGFVKILKQYQEKYGMRFFSAMGNHDPVRPFTTEAGKKDFLAADGSEIGIYSKGDKKCQQGEKPGKLVCSDDLKKWGYKEIVAEMADFGFFPNDGMLYFETPFGTDNFDFEARQLTWCAKSNPNNCIQMPDTSYVAEPIAGLWLLSIDSNVYAPKDPENLTTDGNQFVGSSNAGYNAMLEFKPEIIEWIADVVKRAKQQGKQLIAFSHYPMTDFYDGAGEQVQELFGKGKLHTKRIPKHSTAKVLANTGLQVHVGGHLHINDTGTVKADDGHTLFNIQAPTLAAYRPAYKLLTLHSPTKIEVETVIFDQVPRFKELFPHYEKELAYLRQHKADKAWSESILEVQSYGELTDSHLTELVKLRFIPREWPKDLINYLQNNSVEKIIKLGQQCSNGHHHHSHNHALKGSAIQFVDDFYRLRNADSIALLSEQKKQEYLELAHTIGHCDDKTATFVKLQLMLTIMAKFIEAQPSEHIWLDLKSGEIQVSD